MYWDSVLKNVLLTGVYNQKFLETTVLEGCCVIIELHKIYKPCKQQALASSVGLSTPAVITGMDR